MAGNTQVIYRAGKHPFVHNVRFVAESMSSFLASHASCQVTARLCCKQLRVFCLHTLKLHCLNRQVSYLAELSHTLHSAGML